MTEPTPPKTPRLIAPASPAPTLAPIPARTPPQAPPYALTRETLENEVRIDTYRASGPGGQHVNKTNSAIRLTHAPSGVVVIAQDSSSQFRNKEIAFERLLEKLTRLNHVPKKRFATKPSRAAKEKRIVEKKTRGEVKSIRRKNVSADE
jgi:protein subunit release factor A